MRQVVEEVWFDEPDGTAVLNVIVEDDDGTMYMLEADDMQFIGFTSDDDLSLLTMKALIILGIIFAIGLFISGIFIPNFWG